MPSGSTTCTSRSASALHDRLTTSGPAGNAAAGDLQIGGEARIGRARGAAREQRDDDEPAHQKTTWPRSVTTSPPSVVGAPVTATPSALVLWSHSSDSLPYGCTIAAPTID